MINEEDYLAEITHCIKERDAIKLKVLLKEFSNVSAGSGQKLLLEVCKTEDDFSIPLFLFIMTRLPNIVQAIPTVVDVLGDKIADIDDCSKVFGSISSTEEKCVFLESLIERKKPDTSSFLIKLLRSETEIDICRSVLRTMEEIRDPEFAIAVADFLYSDDYKLVLQAIETLGRCVSPTGIQALTTRAGNDLTIDKRIIKSLAEAGTKEAIDSMVNMLGSGVAHLRNFARVALVTLKERSIDSLVQTFGSGDKDMIIIALNTLGESGVPEAVKPIRKLLQSHPADANIRFSAYESLGLLPIKAGAYTLTDGLSDEVETVRVAAAKAVDHLFDKMFHMGLSNILAEHENPKVIVEAFLVAECTRVFAAMIDQEVFSMWVYAYFTENPQDSLLEIYAPLDSSGHLQEILSKKAPTAVPSDFQVCIVDDSRLLLRIYRKMFDELGLKAHLFEFAEAALEFVKETKPSLILTDLNMPGMDGIEFSRAVRTVYSANELPIVMVTTQDEGSDTTVALEAGVQQYLNKPFTKEMVAEVVATYKK
ncbi:MAG: response regulator [Lentisphaeraceae bacterium]|nr:response regulator [Lentisphaeraceae bacterium]